MGFESSSYWQRTSPAISLRTDLPGTVDVAIIGGGLLGASTCYWLAYEGISVALLERTALAYGATGRNGGFVRVGSAESYPDAISHLGHETARDVMTLTRESQALLRQVVYEENLHCDYREPGTIRLALNEEQSEKLKNEVQLLRTDGIPAEFFDRNRLQQYIHTSLAPCILSGRWLPEQGLVHSARLVQGLVNAAVRRGAQTYQAELFTLASTSGGTVILQTSRGRLQARSVVVAVNAWTSKLFPEFAGVIVPAREQMLAYAPIEPIFSAGVTADMTTGEYWQQTQDGTVLIGGCSSTAPHWDMGVWEVQPTKVVQEAIEQILPSLFPLLAPKLSVAQRWAGLIACTTDTLPIIDRAPTLPNVFIVGGFSGHGMPFGMRVGQLLAESVKSGTLSPELKPYQLGRPTLKKWDLTNI
jgi:gamma-glutamylputrescine oxidase